jgi:3-oxoacyl-[acyl-carrier protein] reductase
MGTNTNARGSRKLRGKVAVVTGASKGIGGEIARQLAAEGASVVVNYSSDKAGAERVVADITKRDGNAVAVQANVAKRADVERLLGEAKKQFGRLDVLVNNAGIYEFAPLESVTEENFHKQFDTNVLSVLLASQAALRYFDAAAGGSIINIGSIASRAAPPMASVYSATKAAVDAVTRSLSQELAARKIRVNSINPGTVVTEGVRSAGLDKNDFGKQVLSRTPLGRLGEPQDIAPAAVFLASDDSSWITGEAFYIAGGLR